MGLKGILTLIGWNTCGVIATVISFAAFVGIVIWTLTRPQHEIDAAARLWMDDEQ